MITHSILTRTALIALFCGVIIAILIVFKNFSHFDSQDKNYPLEQPQKTTAQKQAINTQQHRNQTPTQEGSSGEESLDPILSRDDKSLDKFLLKE